MLICLASPQLFAWELQHGQTLGEAAVPGMGIPERHLPPGKNDKALDGKQQIKLEADRTQGQIMTQRMCPAVKP